MTDVNQNLNLTRDHNLTMIALREDKFILDIPLKDIIDIDTKVNILECFRLINMKVSSRYTKVELAEIYDMFFHKDTGWVLNKIPIVE